MSGKQKIIEERLHKYFSETITPKEFAKSTRRLLYVLIDLHLENNNREHEEWIKSGRYWLNEFAEILDPQLED